MRKNKNRAKKERSLREKLLFSFALFVFIVIVVLWAFQTFLLDDVYMNLKLGELKKCASESDTLAESDTEEISERLGAISKKLNICISAYKVEDTLYGKTAESVADCHVNSFCFIHNVRSENMLNNLYSSAKENGGEYTERFSLASVFGKRPGSNDDTSENVVISKIIKKDSSELFVVYNTELLPLDSTVSTLKVQLIYITLILTVIALFLAYFISARISKPIREMSGEASKLALGNYNVNFDGGNCLETVNLSIALNRAAYELSKLDKMQKDLIANVSHDLRTPLTMIEGYTEAMRDIPGEATPENMQIVIDETKRLTSLVNDMLEVSRYQGGMQKLNITRFNFTEVIRTTLERYAKLREHEGYTIDFVADRDVFVRADEGRILQVVYNLINNAVNYVGEDKTVIIRQIVGDGSVLLEVEDHGIGIPEDELPLVWERYYKVNDFHKRANMGTGLGLSIVKNILLLHGAEFGVKRCRKEGSIFWFKLKTDDEEDV